MQDKSLHMCVVLGEGYMPHEGPCLANQTGRKLGVFARKLEGTHSIIL